VTKVRKINFSAWLKITNDLWVLDTVKNGYQIEFNVFPQGSSFMNEIQFSKEKTEIDKLLMKGAIKEVDSVEDQLISNLFKVPQKDGSFRPVVNLKKMNLFVEYHHFKQENLSIGLDIIQKNDYLTSMDLTDAYFSISINNEFKKCLRFSWKGTIYEFSICT
jgi:hypothetical protein